MNPISNLSSDLSSEVSDYAKAMSDRLAQEDDINELNALNVCI